MRIGINAQLCSPSLSYRNAGVSRYISNLVRALGELDDAGCDIHLFLPAGCENETCTRHNVHRRSWQGEGPAARIAWEQFVLPVLSRTLRLDVLHSPMHVLPVVCPTASVVTVLDLTFMRYPEAFPRHQRMYLEYATRRAVAKADAVIAISDCTRADVINQLHGDPDRVFTIPLAADDSFRPATVKEVAEIRRRYGVGETSVLYLGTLEPRKNIPALLEAFRQVRTDHDGDCRLVLGGGKGWYYRDVFRRVEELGLKDDVVFTGYVSQEDLPVLYSSATVFVYPTLYEGFGLPPLEAMACGTPVITSNTSSLPEVVGDAGVMVNPLSVDEISQAIHTVLSREDLRREMSAAGLERAKRFSWKETAGQTLKVYASAYERSRRRRP